jgi:hypothetical protein
MYTSDTVGKVMHVARINTGYAKTLSPTCCTVTYTGTYLRSVLVCITIIILNGVLLMMFTYYVISVVERYFPRRLTRVTRAENCKCVNSGNVLLLLLRTCVAKHPVYAFYGYRAALSYVY